jgi:hypothetical protein
MLYAALNRARARLVERAEDWRSSSVHALPDPAPSDGLTDTAPVSERVPDFAGPWRAGEDEAMFGRLRRLECTGRPLGGSAFLDQVEALLGRDAKPGKPMPVNRDRVEGQGHGRHRPQATARNADRAAQPMCRPTAGGGVCPPGAVPEPGRSPRIRPR